MIGPRQDRTKATKRFWLMVQVISAASFSLTMMLISQRLEPNSEVASGVFFVSGSMTGLFVGFALEALMKYLNSNE